MDIISDGPTLAFAGHLDGRSTGVVREAIDGHLRTTDGDVVVDVTAVDVVDVTALRVVAVASRRAAREGRRVALRGPSVSFLRMLHLTRMIRFVQIERASLTH